MKSNKNSFILDSMIDWIVSDHENVFIFNQVSGNTNESKVRRNRGAREEACSMLK